MSRGLGSVPDVVRFTVHRQVPRLLGHPAGIRMAVTPALRTRLVPTSNSDQEGPVRLGAGGMPARRRSERMVVVPTR